MHILGQHKGRGELGRWLNQKNPERGGLASYTDFSHQTHFLDLDEHGLIKEHPSLRIKWAGKVIRQLCKAWGNLWGGKFSCLGVPSLCPCPFQHFDCLSSMSFLTCHGLYQALGFSTHHPARFVNNPNSTWNICPFAQLDWGYRKGPGEKSALKGWLYYYTCVVADQSLFYRLLLALYKVWGLHQTICKVPPSLKNPVFGCVMLPPLLPHWMVFALKCKCEFDI